MWVIFRVCLRGCICLRAVILTILQMPSESSDHRDPLNRKVTWRKWRRHSFSKRQRCARSLHNLHHTKRAIGTPVAERINSVMPSVLESVSRLKMSQGWICSRLRNRLLKGCVRLISFDRPFRQMPPPSLANWTFHSIRKRWIVRSAFFRKFWGGQSDCKILIWTGVPEKLSFGSRG